MRLKILQTFDQRNKTKPKKRIQYCDVRAVSHYLVVAKKKWLIMGSMGSLVLILYQSKGGKGAKKGVLSTSSMPLLCVQMTQPLYLYSLLSENGTRVLASYSPLFTYCSALCSTTVLHTHWHCKTHFQIQHSPVLLLLQYYCQY